MSTPPEEIKNLSPEKRAKLLKQILGERMTVATRKRQSIQPRSAKEPAPLSFSQQRLWLVSRMEPENPLYNVPTAFRIKGALDTESLRKAFIAAAQRHESLRTLYKEQDGEPVQEIVENAALELATVDLSNRPEGKRLPEAEKLILKQARRPFDLSRDFPCRPVLFRLDQEDHILLIVEHHIASDAWSRGILFRDISSYYKSFCGGEEASLPDLPIQYADFAVWQRGHFQGPTLENQLKYWEQRLAGSPPLFPLPSDRPRPLVQSFRGATESFLIGRALLDSLGASGRQENCTLFMTLLALFKTLLFRYTCQEDLIVGSPIAGRNWIETENLTGFFINNLVLRTDLSGNPTFRQLLGRVRDVCIQAYAHQDAPFEKLIERIQPKRNPSCSPLFQVMFVLQSAPSRTLELPGLDIVPVDVQIGTSRFDLTLWMTETPEGLRGKIEYATDLFDRSTIRSLVEHIQVLIDGILRNPDQPIGDIPLLTATERHQILVEWNNTKTDYPRDACLHQLFEAQVEKTPGAVAVVFESLSLTYRELNIRANQLAHYLCDYGVGPETLVGVCMERSVEMIVGLLGILKAGGAYVPLDPSNPKERLSFMLKDTSVPILLSQSSLLDGLPENESHVIPMDTDWQKIRQSPETNVESGVRPDNLAYVIYTSGSTGKPKGVMNAHRGIGIRLLWMQDAFRLTDADRVLHKTPLTFDVSIWEIFWPLITGSRLVLARPNGHADFPYLVRLISEQQVSVLHFVPSMLRLFLDESDLQVCKSLRQVVCSGEALSFELQEKFFDRIDADLHNLYGPTEASIDVTAWTCRKSSPLKIVPIGRPIANTQIYILNSELEPVPVGVTGEIYIGGQLLARGYLNQPELTKERFLPNPFSPESSARLYRTGDLARFLADGNIEYLGRVDNQIKIRGCRIEPREIEEVILNHPAVRDCVAGVTADPAGAQHLTVFLVWASAEHPSMAAMQKYLAEKLPIFMLPDKFVVLDALPLMANGKIDHRSLFERTKSNQKEIRNGAEPQDEIENSLAHIWAETLGCSCVGLNDSFLDLGGHSLLAIRILGRIHDRFGIQILFRDFFAAATIAGVAKLIRDGIPHPRTQIPKVSRSASLPTSFIQEQFWLFAERYPDSVVYNETFTIRLGGPIDPAALRRSLDEIVRRHEILRTTISVKNAQPVQVIFGHSPVQMTVLDYRNTPEAERENEAVRQATAAAKEPFDLTRLPLWRSLLVILSDTDYRLYMTMHHSLFDAFGLYRIFVPELSELYNNYTGKSPCLLPEHPIQYADYCRWQRQQINAPSWDTHLSYWRKQLDDAPALEIPADYSRPLLPSHRGHLVHLSLSDELTKDLKDLSRKEGVTLYTTLLSAFAAMLSRYSGREDFVIGTVLSTRSQPETESNLGCMFEMLPLRVNLEGSPSGREVLQRTKDAILEMQTHISVPLMKLVETLCPQPGKNRHPFFDVVFVMEPEVPPYESGWNVGQLEVHNGTAKFDITIQLEERAGEIIGGIEYCADLYDRPTVERMIGHFQTLLQGVVDNPDQKLSELPLLTEAERHQILVEWNNTESDYPKDACIHQLFESQVEKTPDAVAVVFENQTLTYRELNARANQLAYYLRDRGVGPDAMVGICVERSLEMIVGLLGILKAGGAYVPLDPTCPEERLAFMLDDAQITILLTQQKLLPSLQSASLNLIYLDSDWHRFASQISINLATSVSAHNLAYVNYTSGSTGLPKGVLVPHRSVARLLFGVQYARFSDSQKFLQLSTLSFDASTFEIWGALLHGATCVLFPDRIPTIDRLENAIRQNGIDTLWLTSSLFNAVIDTNPQALKQIRQLLIGGEALSPSHIQRALEELSGTEITNGYGPTEGTTFTCCYRIPRQMNTNSERIPIGRPIANTTVYVLDANMQPVPVGIPGELYVGGDGLARAYLNRPELTECSFVPNPFSPAPGDRLYKSGDRVKWLPNGDMDFLGRTDDQVKIRGYRIELGEIECTLDQHPMIRKSVVICRGGTSESKCLVAYIVPLSEGAYLMDGVRAFLKEKLPDYMIPSLFIPLKGLPITPSGKINRDALPKIDDEQREPEHGAYVAPRDNVEEKLAAIMEELLHRQRIGVRADFFDMGGHSLLAVKLLRRIEEAFSKKLRLASLFQECTVEHLAKLLRDGSPARHGGSIVKIRSGKSAGPLFLVHALNGELPWGQLIRHMRSDRTIYGLQLPERNGVRQTFPDMKLMVAHYVDCICDIQSPGPCHIAGYSYGGKVALEIAQQLKHRGREVGVLAIIDTGIGLRSKNFISGHMSFLLLFARNLPFWVRDDLIKTNYRDLHARIRRKLRTIKKRVSSYFDHDRRNNFRLELEDIFEQNSFDEQEIALKKIHLKAWQDYTPRKYAGRVTLLCARTRPLLHSLEPDLGWSQIAQDGVDIRIIPGHHGNILDAPNIQHLAVGLEAALENWESIQY